MIKVSLAVVGGAYDLVILRLSSLLVRSSILWLSRLVFWLGALGINIMAFWLVIGSM